MQPSRLKYTEIYPPTLSVKIIKLNFQIMPFSIGEISEIRSSFLHCSYQKDKRAKP